MIASPRLVALASAVVLIACSTASTPDWVIGRRDAIVGKWVGDLSTGKHRTFEFFPDGRLNVYKHELKRTLKGEWTAVGSEIRGKYGSKDPDGTLNPASATFTAKFNGHTMTGSFTNWDRESFTLRKTE